MINPKHLSYGTFGTFEEAKRHATRAAEDAPGIKIIIARAYVEVQVQHMLTVIDPVEAESTEEISDPRFETQRPPPPPEQEQGGRPSAITAEFMKPEQEKKP